MIGYILKLRKKTNKSKNYSSLDNKFIVSDQYVSTSFKKTSPAELISGVKNSNLVVQQFR